MRNIRSSGIGGRPAPVVPFGYTGSTSVHSCAHGTTRSISARKRSRRVGLRKASNPVAANVGCIGFFILVLLDRKGPPLESRNKSDVP